MFIVLSAKNNLGLIDGTILEPKLSDPLFPAWNRCNDMVISWLLHSLSREIAEIVIYFRSVREIWKELKDRFGQSNGPKLYQLQKELSDLQQGVSDGTGYYTKVKRIWNELDCLDTSNHCTCDCTCGGKEKTSKSHQVGRLISFIMGLNDTYSGVRSNILMCSPFPNINQAYSLLVQYEKQREIKVAQHPAESIFLVTRNQRFTNPRTYDGRRNNLICSHCKKPGYSAEKCYRLIGFPVDFKFTKSKKNPPSHVFGNTTIGIDPEGINSTSHKGITQE
ncbi:hypothetical protein P3L10_005986 [Capsicum annuum]